MSSCYSCSGLESGPYVCSSSNCMTWWPPWCGFPEFGVSGTSERMSFPGLSHGLCSESHSVGGEGLSNSLWQCWGWTQGLVHTGHGCCHRAASQAFKRPLLSQDPRNDLCLSREHRAETHSLQVRLCFTATFPEDSGKNIACCLVLLKNTICTALSLLSTETSKCHRRSLLAIVRPCGGGEEHSFTKQHMLGKVAFSLNQGSVDAIYSEKQTLTGRN